MEFQLIFTIIPPPVHWNIFILLCTYKNTCHLLRQLSFCTIFQGRHDKIRLVHHLATKNHGASGDGSKKSPDHSITGFKMIFNHQNLGIDTAFVQIFVISAEIWHKIEFSVLAGHFVPVYPFWTILSKVPSYSRLYNVIWPSKLGFRHLICADITDNDRYMIQNIIFVSCGTFCPGLPFSDHFDKGTPL